MPAWPTFVEDVLSGPVPCAAEIYRLGISIMTS